MVFNLLMLGIYPPMTDLFSGFANAFSNNPLITAGFMAIFMLVILVISGVRGNVLLYLGMFFVVGLAGWRNSVLGIDIVGIGGGDFTKVLVLFTILMTVGIVFGILRWSGLLRG